MSVRPTRVATGGEESHSPYAAIQERYRWNSEQWEPKSGHRDGIEAADWWKRNDDTIAAKADEAMHQIHGDRLNPVVRGDGKYFATVRDAVREMKRTGCPHITPGAILNAIESGERAFHFQWSRPGTDPIPLSRNGRRIEQIDPQTMAVVETHKSVAVAAVTVGANATALHEA
jgi:hypothetical protein